MAGVVVAGAVSVLVDVVVVSVVVVAVEAAVPVSSTTAGASVWVVVSVVVVSFFWQPVESATAAMAARPRVRNFFINLISFFFEALSTERKSETVNVGKSTRNHIRTGPPVNTPRGPSTPGHCGDSLGDGPFLGSVIGQNGGYGCSRVSEIGSRESSRS